MGDSIRAGAELRRRRQTLGLTLEALSNGICSAAYLSLIEQGHRQASQRIEELLFARLNANAGETGVAISLAALRVAEWQVRQSGGLTPEVRKGPPLRNHQLFLDALESEVRSELGTALAQLDTWLAANDNSRDLKSFGGRVRIRLLRELGRDAEALKYASELLIAASQNIKSRHDDLLDIAFQTAEMYSAAGLWRDALRVIDQHRDLVAEPRQKVNAHWAASTAYYTKGDIDNALTEVNAAIDALASLDLPVASASLTNNSIWYELHAGILDPHTQLARLDEAVAVLRTNGHAKPLAWANLTYALLHAKLGNTDAFKQHAHQALTLSIDAMVREHDELVVALAEIAVSFEEPSYAQDLLGRLDARTRKIPPIRAEAVVLYRAGKVAQLLGEFERAFGYLDASHALLGFTSQARN